MEGIKPWSFAQNKGQIECVDLFIKSIKNNTPSPIPFDEILEVSRVTIKAQF